MTTWDFIIALFYHVDEQLYDMPKHPEAHLWPSEVVTLGLVELSRRVTPLDWSPSRVEGRRACGRWRVSRPALSIAGWVHSSTMATFPAPATSNGACGCRDRNVARATVGGEFPICTLSVVGY
jgi:hypothetical protein